MLSVRLKRKAAFVFLTLVVSACLPLVGNSQAALLLEQPYGFFGEMNPTGHNAIYLRRVCAETPVKLRRCEPDEMGVVISRYQGIAEYDWIAIPLLPYLYSVETAADVPAHVDRAQVRQLRDRYFEAHLQELGENLPPGSLVRGGWTELVGIAYERRIYAFRFDTTPEQDEALIARLNNRPNRSHFNLFYNNCADFARVILNSYFPRTFNRTIFPDAGMTTPKQITYKLVRYSRKHPETHLAALEIPQVPGYRRQSHSNKTIAESLTTTGYAIPIVFFNPYLAGGIFIDYLVRGRFIANPKNPAILAPDNLMALTSPASGSQNAENAKIQASRAPSAGTMETQPPEEPDSGLKETKVSNE